MGLQQDLTVAPALGSLSAGFTDLLVLQKELVLAKLGTQGQGEQHPACWRGPGCRHPSREWRRRSNRQSSIQARFLLQEACLQGSQWPHPKKSRQERG